MRYYLFLLMIISTNCLKAQDKVEDIEWFKKYESEIYYGLSNFPITSFLKIEEGILVYSHPKRELRLLNNEHLVEKKWNIKVMYDILENPTLSFYDEKTVVLGSFINRKSYWISLKNYHLYKDTDQLNPGSKYLYLDNFHYLSFADHRVVMNQYNAHPHIFASLYAYKGLRKRKLYSLDIPASGIGSNGNILDPVNYNNHLWVLDVLNKKILLFNTDLNRVGTKDIRYLWTDQYLRRLPKQGLAINIDCQFLFDHLENKLYMYTMSYERDENGLRRLTQVHQLMLKENNEITLKLAFERPTYLAVKQISGGTAYFTAGGEELHDPYDESYDFDGKTDFVYQLKFDAID